YKERMYRPDGTPQTEFGTGIIQRKEASQSFLNLKESTRYFVDSTLYGNIRNEEGQWKKVLTPSEKAKRAEIERLLVELEIQKESGQIDEELYEITKRRLDNQNSKLGKVSIGSKYGDNVLKYVQLK